MGKKRKLTTAVFDLAALEEDRRIEVIGKTVLDHGKVCAFVVDADRGKADRYIAKLLKRFPTIAVLDRFDGPVQGTVTVKVGPPGTTESTSIT